MAANIFPLLYNPGIQRDGTTFQSEYCTDGQWIRFQRGKVRKIGGMKGAITVASSARVTNLAIFPSADEQEILIFICSEQGLFAQINSPGWILTANNNLLQEVLPPTVMWTTETVVHDKKTYIVFMQNNNAININDNSVAKFYRKEIITALAGTVEITALPGVDPSINGGLCFSFPFLFLYGSNGLVQYSRSSDPFNFDGENSDSFSISTDKVIFASPIRGGSNSPTLLFWTLSSVVRVTNALSSSDSGAEADFQSDVISNSSSILSSKCVVEYDGLFFWPGTDRFFVYNGIVQEMDNRLNLNYFFDNIDMARRQQVFGVKNTKYGEIWWFYPVIGGAGANSRAVVYNKRENFWYDTAISRTAGVFSSDFGFMSTYGEPIVAGSTPQLLWKHEVGVVQEGISGGALSTVVIPSYFTTPIFSWVAFPPKVGRTAYSSQLINRWIDLQRIEPDFITGGVASAFQVVANTREYAQSPITSSVPVVFGNTTTKVDMRVQGRNMSLTFSSTGPFEVGQIMLLLGIGDGR
jgi:hypothetical protein